MLIKDIITARDSIFKIQKDVSLLSAAKELKEKRIGALPVTDENENLIGIISERDIIRICADIGAAAMESKVSAAMTTKLEVASSSDTVDMALARMTDRRIRHLPVVEGGKLIGIVSIGDLVKAQIDAVLAEADAMRAYIHS